VVCQQADRKQLSEKDANRWDANVHQQALVFLWVVYSILMPAEKDFLNVMEQRGKKPRRGTTKNGSKYSVLGTVQSGDGDTTCGNTFLHMCIKYRAIFLIMRLVLRHRGEITMADMLKLPYRAIIMGDDDAEVTTSGFNSLIESIFVRVGVLAGHNIVADIKTEATLEFCSGLFYPRDNGDYVFGPKAGRVLSKTFYSRTKYGPAKAKGWVRGVAKSLENMGSQVPVLSVVINKVLELTEGVCVVQDKANKHRIKAESKYQVSDATYIMCSQRYDISVQDIKECESYIDKHLTSLPMLLEHPVLTRMKEVDA